MNRINIHNPITPIPDGPNCTIKDTLKDLVCARVVALKFDSASSYLDIFGICFEVNLDKHYEFTISPLFFEQDSRKYTGIVEDCCCDYETVDSVNGAVKLWCDCPFWPDDGMCRLRDCSVCECLESEFPEPIKRPSLLGDDVKCQEGKPEAVVDHTLDAKAFRGWAVVDNPWTNDDETDNG
ncbi:endoplasmic reticulum oxidoreductin-1, partial [Tanacetum coccineum]